MIKLDGIRKCYGDLVAVDSLSLSVEPGEILALLGPNGAGKSTTVQCIVGLLQPDAGTILIDGKNLTDDPQAARRIVSYLPEVASLHEALTSEEYLTLKGRLFSMSEESIATTSERLLRGFQIFDRRHEPIGGFSKGMTQKVALAASLLTDPRVLVLDEPLAGLDVETTMVLKEVLRAFARDGGTVIYCSHLLDVVETLADRVAVIDHGRLLASGTLDDLRRKVGTDASLERLFAKLTQAGDPAVRAREILGDTSGSSAAVAETD